MKKLLKVSLMAMLVAAPFAARAEGEPVDSNNPLYTGVDATAVADVASTSYVKGAYNDAIGKINKVASIKQDNLMNNAGTPAAVSSTVKTSVGAATGQDAADDTSLVTEKAVRDAITAAQSATTYTQGSGIAIDANNEISASGITTSNIAANAGILKTQLAQGVQDSLDLADSALQASDVDQTYDATSANAQSGVAVASAISAAGANYATAAQGALADSALQASDVDQTYDATSANAQSGVAVASAISAAGANYATAAQGALADTALQASDITSTYSATGTDAVNGTAVAAALATQRVTVHTTWNSDSTTAPAAVLVTAN